MRREVRVKIKAVLLIWLIWSAVALVVGVAFGKFIKAGQGRRWEE